MVRFLLQSSNDLPPISDVYRSSFFHVLANLIVKKWSLWGWFIFLLLGNFYFFLLNISCLNTILSPFLLTVHNLCLVFYWVNGPFFYWFVEILYTLENLVFIWHTNCNIFPKFIVFWLCLRWVLSWRISFYMKLNFSILFSMTSECCVIAQRSRIIKQFSSDYIRHFLEMSLWSNLESTQYEFNIPPLSSLLWDATFIILYSWIYLSLWLWSANLY